MDNKWPLILRAGVVAGVMDGLGASLMFYWRTGKGPEGVFRYVASGALGNVAFTGNAAMAVVGVIFHLIIAFIWALIYVRFSEQIRQVVRSWVVSGVLYAIFVWMIMNLVIIPLSRTPDVPLTWMGAVRGALVLVFCIGLPIAFITHRYYESGKASQ
jgi:uncharacterized membrane protein YagU involved in acid resistance